MKTLWNLSLLLAFNSKPDYYGVDDLENEQKNGTSAGQNLSSPNHLWKWRNKKILGAGRMAHCIDSLVEVSENKVEVCCHFSCSHCGQSVTLLTAKEMQMMYGLDITAGNALAQFL